MSNEESQAVVLLSGGIDSATCLALACDEYDVVKPVFVNYGQQTNEIEEERAWKQAHHFGEKTGKVAIPKSVDCRNTFRHFAEGTAGDRDSFTNKDGSLENEDGRSTGYVPMRNLHLIATASGIADVRGADAVFHGAQGGDEESYPDCRQAFMDAAHLAVNRSLADDDYIDIRTPLISLDKSAVIEMGEEMGVAWELTYSCYKETDIDDPDPCGECPACKERIEAFEAAGVEDPVMQ